MARVYSELWLSLASIPHDSSEEAPMYPQRRGSSPLREMSGDGSRERTG